MSWFQVRAVIKEAETGYSKNGPEPTPVAGG